MNIKNFPSAEMKKLFWSIFFSFAICFPGYTQAVVVDSLSTKIIPLDEVTIEASRSDTKFNDNPASVAVLSKSQVQGSQSTLSLEESLRRIPGVFVNNRFNFSQGDRISIRGIGSRSQFGVRGIKMVLDGIPLTMADGQSQTNNIDLASIGKIEIIKGASSVLYGNSSGGVIYMSSQASAKEKLVLTPAFLFGSFGLQKLQLKASGTLQKLEYLINANNTKSKGFRDFSSSEFYNFNGIFKYKINNNSTLTYILNYYNAPYLLNPGASDAKTILENRNSSRKFNQLQGAGKYSSQLQTGLAYKLNFSRNQSIQVSIYEVVRNLYNPIIGRIIDLKRNAQGFRGTYHKDYFFNETTFGLTLGLDLENQFDTRSEFMNKGIDEAVFPSLNNRSIITAARKGNMLLSQREKILGKGLFYKADFKIKNWIFNLGGRFDQYTFKVEDKMLTDNSDDSGKKILSQFNPSIGIIYKYASEVNFYSNYSSAFQTPSANEFGNLPTGAGGFNTNLQPERIKSLEIGIRGSFFEGILSYDFATFFMGIENQLIPYQTADTTVSEVFYRNAGKTRNSGFDFNLNYIPVKRLSIALSYSINDFRIVDYKVENKRKIYQLRGNRIPGIPYRRVFGAVQYEFPIGLSAEINVQYVDGYFTNDFNGPVTGTVGGTNDYKNKAYTQLDFRMAFERKIGILSPKFYGGINNILNLKYNSSIVVNATANRFFEPAPGINFYVGVSIPLVVVK